MNCPRLSRKLKLICNVGLRSMRVKCKLTNLTMVFCVILVVVSNVVGCAKHPRLKLDLGFSYYLHNFM